MDYKKQIIDKVESFYLDVVEEFKEAELSIIKDSKFKMIFKKKNIIWQRSVDSFALSAKKVAIRPPFVISTILPQVILSHSVPLVPAHPLHIPISRKRIPLSLPKDEEKYNPPAKG